MTSLDQTVFDDSSKEPSAADRGGQDVEAATAANLLSALAARLRAAYEQGTDISGLAAASHQSTAEVRMLLQQAGAALPPEGQDRVTPVRQPGRPTPEAQQSRPARRPTPSRRLSRLHPRTEPDPADRAATPAEPPAPPEVRSAAFSSSDRTPMGILIGASPTYSEPPAQPEDRHPRRVPARVIRVGRGTCLVVLPSWRASIAVSVPTELLVRATGLSPDQLAAAQLTVLMNPEALHDRELDLHEWQSEPELPGKRGRHGAG